MAHGVMGVVTFAPTALLRGGAAARSPGAANSGLARTATITFSAEAAAKRSRALVDRAPASSGNLIAAASARTPRIDPAVGSFETGERSASSPEEGDESFEVRGEGGR